MSTIQPGDHKAYMRLALEQAQKSPPKPTNYRVGAVLVDSATNEILATGYTLELPGNTHAEQCCFMKLADKHGVPEENLKNVLPSKLALYTTVEPCSKRLSGNIPCVQRVLRLASSLQIVYVGIMEPETFVAENTGKTSLQEAGISVIHVEGFEKEILEVATAGHIKG
jgi:pyrimidine deaminase RibD-like protein